jgi:uncharacterized protein YecT (DUF1311 family)
MELPTVRIAILFLSLIVPGQAQHLNEPDSPCAKVVITSDLAACLSKARASADAELNSAYRKLLERLDANDAERLSKAQRLWTQYRDANCLAERLLYAGGTASSPAFLACLEAMTRSRTREIYVTYAVKLK